MSAEKSSSVFREEDAIFKEENMKTMPARKNILIIHHPAKRHSIWKEWDWWQLLYISQSKPRQ